MHKRSPSPHLVMAALLVLGAALLLAACGSSEADSGPTPTPLPGTVLEPPKPVGDFTLTAHTGDPIQLSDLQGHVVVLYFGYTNCPDICPTTLASYKRVKAALDDNADQVRFMFIGVDPERDTITRLADYVTAFDPEFIGATGDDATLRSIANDYGVFFQRVDYDNDINYLVDHTASTFIVGPEGALRVVVPYGTEPETTAQHIRNILADS